jgi:hypothetical protein
MLRLEAECGYDDQNDDMVKAYSVKSGEFQNIDFLGSTKVSIFGPDLNKGSGRVIMSGKSRGIKAIKYENEEDNEGKVIDIKHPIDIFGKEELSIFINKKINKKEIFIYLSSDNDLDREIGPRGDIYKEQSEPFLSAA